MKDRNHGKDVYDAVPLEPETVFRLGQGLSYLSTRLDLIADAWSRLQRSTQAGAEDSNVRKFFESLTWAHYYDLPPLVGLLWMFTIGGAHKKIDGLASSILAISPLKTRQILTKPWNYISLGIAAPAITAAKRSIDSMVINHALMSVLIDRVRVGGENADEAFFQALGIDPGALLSRRMQRRYRRAVITQDTAFLAKVGYKLSDPIIPEHLRSNDRLQVALFLLAHIGALYRITSADMAYELLVKQGRLYKGEKANAEAKANLWRLVRNAQNRYRKELPEEFSSLQEKLVNMLLLPIVQKERTNERQSKQQGSGHSSKPAPK